ncbi:MAG: polysaccharide biosynthesis tyrosine autokinase, partial [Deltaproteobacteria bacterium]
MANERRQLDETRQDVQRAAEAAGQGSPSQALASGTRAQSQLQQLRDQMRKENSSQFAEDLREMRAEARELARREEEISKKLETLDEKQRRTLSEAQHQALELNLREIEYGRLLRERENNIKLYGIVLERTKETDLTRLMRVNNIRVMDEALLPGVAVKPNVVLNLGIGTFAGLVLGVLVAVLLVGADRSVRSQSDIEEMNATFLGLLPRIYAGKRRRKRYGSNYSGYVSGDDAKPVTNPDMVMHTHPQSAIAEAMRAIRTNLLFMSPDEPFQTLMVTSADAREGKTTMAMCLAITLAQSGKKVLIVDADLRRPRVHRALGLNTPVGLTSVLVNEATLDEAMVETDVPNLTALVAGTSPPNPAELLHSHRFEELLRSVRTKFDRVIIDTPPIGPVSDALVISTRVDGTVLVVRFQKTARSRAGAVLGQLRQLGARVAGVILNDVDMSKTADTTYYYSGSYSYRHRRDAA